MYETAETFIKDNSKVSENVRTMVQSKTFDYIETVHSITQEQVKACSEAKKNLVNGGIGVAVKDLATSISEAKERGEDPSDLTSVVKIAHPDGQLNIGVSSVFHTRRPATQEPITIHGHVTVTNKTASLIDTEVKKKASEVIGALMG